MEPVLMENIHHRHNNKDLEKGAIWIVKNGIFVWLKVKVFFSYYDVLEILQLHYHNIMTVIQW